MTRARVVVGLIVLGTLAVLAAFALVLVAIWTGDARWGYTGIVSAFFGALAFCSLEVVDQ